MYTQTSPLKLIANDFIFQSGFQIKEKNTVVRCRPLLSVAWIANPARQCLLGLIVFCGVGNLNPSMIKIESHGTAMVLYEKVIPYQSDL